MVFEIHAPANAEQITHQRDNRKKSTNQFLPTKIAKDHYSHTSCDRAHQIMAAPKLVKRERPHTSPKKNLRSASSQNPFSSSRLRLVPEARDYPKPNPRCPSQGGVNHGRN
jgi:hypothetical protein